MVLITLIHSALAATTGPSSATPPPLLFNLQANGQQTVSCEVIGAGRSLGFFNTSGSQNEAGAAGPAAAFGDTGPIGDGLLGFYSPATPTIWKVGIDLNLSCTSLGGTNNVDVTVSGTNPSSWFHLSHQPGTDNFTPDFPGLGAGTSVLNTAPAYNQDVMIGFDTNGVSGTDTLITFTISVP